MSWPEDFNTNFQFLLRWLHFLGGITWIGMLYFFNLVNVQLQKEIDASIKPKLNPPLLTKTLWWFRWGAVLTWVTGFIYYFVIAHSEAPGDMLILIFLIGWVVAFEINSVVYKASAKGGGLGTVMFMNVWMIIWPLQKKIIAATKATAETGAAAPAEMPQWARRAFLASRTNAWLSIPMLFFMGAASHFPIFSVITK